MAISINGVTVAGIGKDGKDATVNGVNALTIEATGGIKGTQSGDTYAIDGSGLFPKSGGELNGDIVCTQDKFSLSDHSKQINLSINSGDQSKSAILSYSSGVGDAVSSFYLSPNSVSMSIENYKNGFVSGVTLDELGITLSSKQEFYIKRIGMPNDRIATESYINDIVGNINTLLDTINGEVI